MKRKIKIVIRRFFDSLTLYAKVTRRISIDVKERMEHPIDTNLSVMGQAEQLINQLEAEKNIFTILYSIGDRVRGLPFKEAVCSEKSRNSRPSL